MKSNDLTPKKKTKVFTVLSIITTIAASLWFVFLVYLAIQTLIDNANYVPGDNTMNSAGIGFALYVIFSAYELIPVMLSVILSIINLFKQKKAAITILVINAIIILTLVALFVVMRLTISNVG